VRRTLRCGATLTAGAALIAVATIAVAVAVAIAVGTGPAAAAGPVRVMQFNICGAECNRGVIDTAGGDIVDDVQRRVAADQPDVVTLNEVCQGQFKRLQTVLGTLSWKMTGVFRAQRSDGRCQGGSGFGDAVFTAGGMNSQLTLPLPNPAGAEHRAVLCVHTSAGGGPVLACVLHTVTGNPMRARQVAAAARDLNAEASNGAVILGGDFNTTPGGMGALLDPGQGGRFFDVDPQKAPTRGDKIDYVLFDRGHFTAPSGGPQGSPYSDHDALVGQATRP
jgi:endonuclease/exonuclease/phosphatase (EEP) superfamily protein YafD